MHADKILSLFVQALSNPFKSTIRLSSSRFVQSTNDNPNPSQMDEQADDTTATLKIWNASAAVGAMVPWDCTHGTRKTGIRVPFVSTWMELWEMKVHRCLCATLS